jgi:hypothetical protein
MGTYRGSHVEGWTSSTCGRRLVLGASGAAADGVEGADSVVLDEYSDSGAAGVAKSETGCPAEWNADAAAHPAAGSGGGSARSAAWSADRSTPRLDRESPSTGPPTGWSEQLAAVGGSGAAGAEAPPLGVGSTGVGHGETRPGGAINGCQGGVRSGAGGTGGANGVGGKGGVGAKGDTVFVTCSMYCRHAWR